MCIFCLVLEQLWTHHEVLSRGEADRTCKRFRRIGFTRQDFCRYHRHDLVRKTHHNRASAVPGKAEYYTFHLGGNTVLNSTVELIHILAETLHLWLRRVPFLSTYCSEYRYLQVNRGVPQGSVLWHLISLIVVNGLPSFQNMFSSHFHFQTTWRLL